MEYIGILLIILAVAGYFKIKSFFWWRAVQPNAGLNEKGIDYYFESCSKIMTPEAFDMAKDDLIKDVGNLRYEEVWFGKPYVIHYELTKTGKQGSIVFRKLHFKTNQEYKELGVLKRRGQELSMNNR